MHGHNLVLVTFLVLYVGIRLGFRVYRYYRPRPPLVAPEPGEYRHFKGNLYYVHGTVRNATNEAGYAPMVYYEVVDKSHLTPEDDGVKANVGHCVRALSEFNQVVKWPDGTRRPRWVKE